ncbi:hypothetical protein C2I36_09525 [Rhodobacteraceae bacterium WD3A24]|nr:hypothetical protein C2I36_09525 [Rhodobacteraceae bacterium WD3A24]
MEGAMGTKVRTSRARFEPVAGGTNRRPTLPAEDWAEDARPFRPGQRKTPDPEFRNCQLQQNSPAITGQEVLDVLGTEWADAKAIHRAIGKGHVDTVRERLRGLRDQGRAKSRKEGKGLVWRRKKGGAS